MIRTIIIVVVSALRILLKLRMMEVVGGSGNWRYKSYTSPVRSSPLTNITQFFYRPDDLPVAQPTVSKH